ncbi:Lrp/AsnC family transcriptional regulator [Candidatus Gracilibacteria bacterium]|nr:Lrp/AsnC family transcriptional regulator [Candidatus Gracilibacteria bacterium]NJM88347.1 Lrp/AsnC family transcriptional regulator [Hydrococcus sp. RU_2_2]NJP20263.1 Lrp/AsnC family transcriptional regulator [Hydrococcus sp. CRU_1_1]NJQ96744.1 Lrp/AsnC family transcriptional regulator [Hydrococcus sp. CSU_1_8]
MTFNSEKILDRTSWKLLQALQTNGRMSFSELGRRVGLTSPAVAERLRRMEEAGVITGYRADVDPEKVGLSLTAIVGLTTLPDRYPQIITLIQNMPEVLECHHVTGNYSFVMKIIARSTTHLEEAIAQLSQYGSTTTSIVLSSPIKVREITNIFVRE